MKNAIYTLFTVLFFSTILICTYFYSHKEGNDPKASLTSNVFQENVLSSYFDYREKGLWFDSFIDLSGDLQDREKREKIKSLLKNSLILKLTNKSKLNLPVILAEELSKVLLLTESKERAVQLNLNFLPKENKQSAIKELNVPLWNDSDSLYHQLTRSTPSLLESVYKSNNSSSPKAHQYVGGQISVIHESPNGQGNIYIRYRKFFKSSTSSWEHKGNSPLSIKKVSLSNGPPFFTIDLYQRISHNKKRITPLYLKLSPGLIRNSLVNIKSLRENAFAQKEEFYSNEKITIKGQFKEIEKTYPFQASVRELIYDYKDNRLHPYSIIDLELEKDDQNQDFIKNKIRSHLLLQNGLYFIDSLRIGHLLGHERGLK